MVVQGVTIAGNWVKNVRDLSVLFLATSCGSIIISELKIKKKTGIETE